jgi:hypothetical protein
MAVLLAGRWGKFQKELRSISTVALRLLILGTAMMKPPR